MVASGLASITWEGDPYVLMDSSVKTFSSMFIHYTKNPQQPKQSRKGNVRSYQEKKMATYTYTVTYSQHYLQLKYCVQCRCVSLFSSPSSRKPLIELEKIQRGRWGDEEEGFLKSFSIRVTEQTQPLQTGKEMIERGRSRGL